MREGIYVERRKPHKRVSVVSDQPTGVTYRFERDGKHRRTSTLAPDRFDNRFVSEAEFGAVETIDLMARLQESLAANKRRPLIGQSHNPKET